MDLSFLRALLILLLPLLATAQTPPPLAFEVASIKPSPPLIPGQFGGPTDTATGLNFHGKTLRYYITYAYRIKDYQLSGPSWLDGLRFDIIAKAPSGSRRSQFDEMLQTLLAQRFNLRIHRETKEIAGLALVVDKGGLKLAERTEHGPGSGAVTAADQAPRSVIEAMSIPMPGVVRTVRLPDGGMRLVEGDVKMAIVAGNLGLLLGTPVFDLTGATGTYDVVIDASRDDVQNQTQIRVDGRPPELTPAELAAPPSQSIFDSLRKLGLRLESRKVPVEIIVVDSADKTPIEN